MKCPHRSLQLVILAEMQACLVSHPLDLGMPSQNHMQRAAKNILRHNLPSEVHFCSREKKTNRGTISNQKLNFCSEEKHKQIQLRLGSSTFVQKENKQTDLDSFCLPKLGQLEMRSHP
jgi:hypothetical protein